MRHGCKRSSHDGGRGAAHGDANCVPAGAMGGEAGGMIAQAARCLSSPQTKTAPEGAAAVLLV